MNVSSSLAGRLSLRGGGGMGRGGGRGGPRGVGRDSSRVVNRSGPRTSNSSGLGEALARRLGMPKTGTTISVTGIKARLGVVRAPHTNSNQQYYSPYPPANERRESLAADQERQRKHARTSDLATRRGIQDAGTQPPASPVMVKMAGGRMVGGMRSDQLRKSPSCKAPIDRRRAPVVALDADRGLTVSLRNKTRDGGPYRAKQGDTRGSRPYEGQRGGGGPGLYNEHDDRAGVLDDNAALPPLGRLHSDLDSEEDVGLELRSRRRRYDSETMDVDSTGGDVYNASLLYTRTTTHHHHHHHHGPSPPPEPPRMSSAFGHSRRPRPQLSPEPQGRLMYRDQLTPPHERSHYRGHSPRGNARYGPASPPQYSPEYSPPPPPQPPSFHPRHQYRVGHSPSPPIQIGKKRPQYIEVVRPKMKSTSSRLVSSKATSSKVTLKKPKLIKRSKLMKPAKKIKKVKGAVKLKGKLVKVKKMRSQRSSSEGTSNSDSESSSSSSSSSSAASSEVSRPSAYQPPAERVLPEPHKQVLDPDVLESIASLQGKEPGYKSGPGPGVKNLVFVPSKTSKSLNQRFTVADAGR